MLELFTGLAEGDGLVTASRRLARTLAHAYEAWRRQAGSTAWRSADILPLSAWLARAHEATFDTRLPLSAQAEQLVWEETIRQAGDAEGLMQLPATARMAARAWQLVREYRLSLDGSDGHSEEVRTFAGWSRRFDAWCQARGLLPQAAIADEIIARIRQGGMHVPPRLWHCGFDELTPQQEALFAALAAAGCEIRAFAWEQTPETAPVRVALADARAEITAAARWSKAMLAARPDSRIGIIVPDLEARRADVERLFQDELLPLAVLPGRTAAEVPFNISLGFSLAAMPLVADALLLLELGVRRSLPLEMASHLVRSPFLGGARAELGARALMDLALRRSREPQASLGWLLRQASGCPQLAAALDGLRAGAEEAGGGWLPSGWAARFAAWLAAATWPGEVAFDSEAWQTVLAFNELLDDFAALDSVLGQLPVRQALARLSDLARQKLFQPESPPDVPIQVLGLLEASGLQFDLLWIMGLHDEIWPQAAHPNPFLPLDAQRLLSMPQSSPDKELAFATLVTERLCRSARQIVFSHPLRDGDRDLQPSPLIAALAEMDAAALPAAAAPGLRTWMAAGGRLEVLVDQIAPPLPEGSLVAGGASLFKLQAACPFRAFTRYRLHATGLEAAVEGLDASDRGSLLHDVLDRLWGRLAGHDALSASPEELDTAIHLAVAEAIARLAKKRPLTLRDRLAVLEEERLTGLVRQWLDLERQRRPFTVAAREAEREIELGGLKVHTRVDRIDAVDGGTVVIDYKTGTTRVADWFGDRPDEPQLPLYAVTAETPVAGILFAQVRVKDMAFAGLCQVDGIAPDVKPLEKTPHGESFTDWPALEAHWRDVLERLAQDFRNGHAAVMPKNGSKTCQYCEYKPLCRIHEQGAETEEGNGDAA